MDFTAEYGLIFGSNGFYCRILIENPSGCKLDMEAQRGINLPRKFLVPGKFLQLDSPVFSLSHFKM